MTLSPRRRTRRFLGDDPLDEAVGAVGEGRAVFPDWTVHETEVLEQHQLAVGVEPVEGFVPVQFMTFLFIFVLRSLIPGRRVAC